MEIDLSKFTTEEIDAMFSAEKLRRRNAAIAELEAVAAEYGYTLADLVGKKRSGGQPGHHRHRKGEVNQIIRHCINEGKTIGETCEILGWKKNNVLYTRAAKMGLKFPRAN